MTTQMRTQNPSLLSHTHLTFIVVTIILWGPYFQVGARFVLDGSDSFKDEMREPWNCRSFTSTAAMLDLLGWEWAIWTEV